MRDGTEEKEKKEEALLREPKSKKKLALLGIVLNLVLPGRSADAGPEKVPPVPRESYDDLARDFERAENGSNEKGQA